MLVIRRRPGESVMIGDGIEVEILDCGHSHVKIGIRAPKEVMVLRKEIHLTAQQNRDSALAPSDEAIERLLNRLR